MAIALEELLQDLELEKLLRDPEELRKTIRSLVRANRALERSAASAEDALLKAFQRAEGRAFTRIAELLAEAPNFSTTNLTDRLAWYFQNVPSLEVAQSNTAVNGAIKSYLDNYPRLGKLAEDVLASTHIPKDLATIPPEVINALKGRDATFFADLTTAANTRLDQQLLDSVILGRTPTNALSQIRGTITGTYAWGKTRGMYEWHAGTYARTAQMRFSRQILKTQAEELDLKTFVYIGPVDSKKRPFCLEIVGGAFNRDEIEDLDNGQTGDTFSDGGGYNCRDTWSPVPKELFDQLREPDNEDLVNEEISRQSPISGLEPGSRGVIETPGPLSAGS